MVGYKIFGGFKYAWKFGTPLLTSATFLTYIANHKPIKYNGIYEYPSWGIAFGWSLAMFSILMLPVSMAAIWFTGKGSCKEVS